MESVNTIHRSTWTKFFWVVLACFIMAPLSSHAFFGGKIKSFSADQVMISSDGKSNEYLKTIYHTGCLSDGRIAYWWSGGRNQEFEHSGV